MKQDRKKNDISMEPAMDRPTASPVSIESPTSMARPAETSSLHDNAPSYVADMHCMRLDRGTVWWKEKSKYIGNTRAYRVLEVLNRRPGWHYHYDILKQEVWGMLDWALVDDNALQQLVTSLRRHFEAAGFVGVEISGRHRKHYVLRLTVS